MKKTIAQLLLLAIGFMVLACQPNNDKQTPKQDTTNKPTDSSEIAKQDTINDHIQLLIPTFLGNAQRNYYGNQAPSRLDVLWKIELGCGYSAVSSNDTAHKWCGAGWTGQALYLREDSTDYLIQGAFDYHLKKINAKNGEIIWQYRFNDILKGTGTIWRNKNTDTDSNRYVILQGSRLGGSFSAPEIYSFRGIAYQTGQELWRFNSKRTLSYSRDVDASAIVVDDTAYIGLENGLLTVFNPDYRYGDTTNGFYTPKVYQEHQLYTQDDRLKHGGNLVTESSPCYLHNHLYLASGSGHVYGYNLLTDSIDWDFYIGSDMDGSAVATDDGCILVAVEKQYIKGPGGIFKLDPRKAPEEAVVWFFPTEDHNFEGWKGGVIGSVGINDSYRQPNDPHLATFIGIDGYLYILEHSRLEAGKNVIGPDNKTSYPCPKLLVKKELYPSISTPIIVKNNLIAACYGALCLYEIDYSAETDSLKLHLLDKIPGEFEATPIAIDKRLYIAARDGNLYCFGEAEPAVAEATNP